MPSREYYRISEEHKKVLQNYVYRKPVPLGAIAKDLGIDVKLSSLDRGLSGLIACNNGRYIIKINRHERRERQRYTLAHEIAHFLLHRDIIDSAGEIADNVLYRSGHPKQIEYEANRLAADLIMPDEFVLSDLSSMKVPITDEVIERLAKEWEVSNAAMEIRLSSYEA